MIVLPCLQATKGEGQIINLGAGFDTTYWNIADEGLPIKNFVEMDFPGVTTKKCVFIKRCKALLARIATEGMGTL